jgi:hypothetical protein
VKNVTPVATAPAHLSLQEASLKSVDQTLNVASVTQKKVRSALETVRYQILVPQTTMTQSVTINVTGELIFMKNHNLCTVKRNVYQIQNAFMEHPVLQ